MHMEKHFRLFTNVINYNFIMNLNSIKDHLIIKYTTYLRNCKLFIYNTVLSVIC